MTEADFLKACERVLGAIEDALDDCGADIQADRQDLVLALEFDDTSKIIVNGNAPMREIWVAAKAGGYHFRWNGQGWCDTRSGDDLFELLSRQASAQAGVAIRLPAPRP